jgi:hypothetical protein
MANYQQLRQTLVQALLGTASPASVPTDDLIALINALPYYGHLDFEAAHRGVLLSLLASNMPNSYIVTQPGSGLTYRDDGTGYQEWFLLGAFESSSGANMAQVLQSQNGTVNAEWWRRYAVAVLTDAIRQVLGFALDTGKLTGDLGNFNSTFLPCLAASCFAVYQNGFTPTANALEADRK